MIPIILFKYIFYIFFSGGHFNPAVTLGVTISGGNPIVVSIFYFLAQMLGGMVGAAFALVGIIVF